MGIIIVWLYRVLQRVIPRTSAGYTAGYTSGYTSYRRFEGGYPRPCACVRRYGGVATDGCNQGIVLHLPCLTPCPACDRRARAVTGREGGANELRQLQGARAGQGAKGGQGRTR